MRLHHIHIKYITFYLSKKMSNNNTFKLYYYNMRGRAEVTRLILAIANRSYNDIRFNYSQWSEYKPKMILGQIPVVEFDDGIQLPQSLTIARYFACETRLAGKDNLESAKIDAIVDTQQDINEKFFNKVVFENDKVKKATELEKFIKEDIIKHCENLTKLKNAYSKNEKYFVGDTLSWADLFVYHSIDTLYRFLPEMKDKLENQFKVLFETIESNPNVKKYLNERPETDL
jgi:glutathione S-transferase